MSKYLYEIISNTGNLTIEMIILRTAISVLFGMVIFASYKMTHTGSIYSKKFNITLVTLTILTTMVMTVIGNNIALSLGMVGALSIIRFRTSIKDSRDTIYIFWTIIIGICCGVGDFFVAGIGSVAVFIVLLLFGRVKNEARMLLIIRADRSKDSAIRKLLFQYFSHPPVIKVQNTTKEKTEMIYEINRKQLSEAEKKNETIAMQKKTENQSLIERLYTIEGIDYVNLVEQSDEIA